MSHRPWPKGLGPGALFVFATTFTVGCEDVTVVFDDAPPKDDGPLELPLNGHLIVANRGSDLLSIVASSGSRGGEPQVQQLSVGFNPVDVDGPRGVVVDPQGRFVYVNLTFSDGGADHSTAHGSGVVPGWLVKLRTDDGREVARVELEPNPGEIAISADGGTAYVTHYDVPRWDRSADPDPRSWDSNLLVISTNTMTVTNRVRLCPAANGLRLSSDEKRLFVACSSDDLAIVELGGAVPEVRRAPLMPGTPGGTGCAYCPYRVSVAPDGTVWVSALGGAAGALGNGRVYIFDPEATGGGAFDLARTIRLEGSPGLVSFEGSATSYRAYLPEHMVPPLEHHGGGTTSPPDHLRTFEVADRSTTPKPIGDIVLEPSACFHPDIAYVEGGVGQLICRGKDKGTVAWLDMDAAAIRAFVEIGAHPDGATIVPPAR